VDVFRLNFSHGTHEEHAATLRAVREVAEAMGHPVGVLQDLGGPKIRLGPIPGDAVECPLTPSSAWSPTAPPTTLAS
jgi:pyruvate kinase